MNDLAYRIRAAAAAACVLTACATPIRSVKPSDIRYVSGQTSAQELVAQAGLPTRRDTIRLNGQDYERLSYLNGPQSITIYHISALATSGNTTVAYFATQHWTVDPEVAMQCLLDATRKVIRCEAGQP